MNEKLQKAQKIDGFWAFVHLASRRSEVDFGPAEMDFGPPGGELKVTSLQNLYEFLAKSMQDPSEIPENNFEQPKRVKSF